MYHSFRWCHVIGVSVSVSVMASHSCMLWMVWPNASEFWRNSECFLASVSTTNKSFYNCLFVVVQNFLLVICKSTLTPAKTVHPSKYDELLDCRHSACWSSCPSDPIFQIWVRHCAIIFQNRAVLCVVLLCTLDTSSLDLGLRSSWHTTLSNLWK